MGEPPVEYLSLRPGVFLTTEAGRLVLLRPRPWLRHGSFGAPTPERRAVLSRLAERPHAAEELTGAGDLLDALRAGGWLMSTVRWAGRDLYTRQPAANRPGGDPPDDPVLSGHALLSRQDGGLVVEAPATGTRVVVHHPAVAALVTGLAHDGAAPVPWPPAVTAAVLGDLAGAGLVEPRSAGPGLWNAHDLWFHRRSRGGDDGFTGGGFGRTGWAAPHAEPPPAPRAGPGIALHRPDLAELNRGDRPLSAVLEERRSIREHDDALPVTAEQLGTLLYRCARARTGGSRPDRPYPAGGGAYELEVYPVVRRVRGLEPGLYHYDPYGHRLHLVHGPGPQVSRLLRGAAGSAMTRTPPQVLLVVAARFGRLMSVYEQLAYALVLKHVGVLYQTLYLVATAMGLAGCALGAGDSAAFTEATGLDYTVESSVGEFALGSRPAAA
jgi:SagB-type dehydrogenase family enzyme